jgi:hypothetical protein
VDIQWQKQWHIYNAANAVADTQQQIVSGGKTVGYTMVDEPREIFNSGYTGADSAVDIQYGRNSD